MLYFHTGNAKIFQDSIGLPSTDDTMIGGKVAFLIFQIQPKGETIPN